MTNVARVNGGLFLCCVIGLALSYYAYVIETAKEHDDNYTAMCDISEHISCSKVLTSEYSKGFGVVRHILGEDSILNQPNCIGGMIFYSVLACLCAVSTQTVAKIQLGMCVLSNIASVYLAIILYYILEDFCLVCVSTYAVNAVSLGLALTKLRMLTTPSASPRAKKKKKAY